MVHNRGNCIPYSTGTTGRPLPIPDPTTPLHTGQQATRKPTGLDWDAHTPTCAVCGQRSGQLNRADICPACRGVLATTPDASTYIQYDAEQLAAKFAPDNTMLGRELGRLAATDPAVAAASARLDEITDRYTHPEDHIQAPATAPDTATAPDAATDPSPAPAAPTAAELLAPPAPSLADEGDRHEQASAGDAPTTDQVENQTEPEDPARVWLDLIPADEADLQVAEHAAIAAAVLTTPVPARPQHRVSDPAHRVEQGLHAANIDAGARHAAQVLTDTAHATDPITRMLRLNVQQAIEALYLYTQLHPQQPASPPAAPQTPVVAAPPAGNGSDRQPATTGTTLAPHTRRGKPGRGKATTPTPSRRGQAGGRGGTTGKLTGHDQTIITRYQAGEPTTQIAADYDCTPSAIRYLLQRNNITLRPAGTRTRATPITTSSLRTTPTGEPA